MQMIRFLDKYGTALILALGVCIYFIHMQHSNIAGFSSLMTKNGEHLSWSVDSPGHLEYIRRLANTLSIPAPDACWECHQPPLYYILAAYAYSYTQDFHLMPPVIAVSYLSLCFYVGFLLFGARLLKMEIHSRFIYYICLCLLIFWPYGVARSTTISNDIPLYMAEAAALYYIMRWRRDNVPGNLALTLLWCGLAIGFKYSGIIILPFIGGLILFCCYKKPLLAQQLFSKKVLLSICFSLVLVGITFARTYYYYRVMHHTSAPLLVPTVNGLVRSMGIPNDRLEYFIFPHTAWYVDSPFLKQPINHVELRYFVNFVLKSSLFSLVLWSPVRTAYVLTVLMFGMLTYIGSTLGYAARKGELYKSGWLPYILFIALHMTALATYRFLYPHFGNQDFRFIYPVTIAMAVLYAKILSWHQAHSRREIFWLGAFLAMGFTCISIVFILLNAWG